MNFMIFVCLFVCVFFFFFFADLLVSPLFEFAPSVYCEADGLTLAVRIRAIDKGIILECKILMCFLSVH